MPARTGQEYIEAISAAEITVEIHGERTTGKVAEIPAFKNLIQTYAALYDLQHDPELRDVMTYDSPTTGERVGTSFLQPRDRRGPRAPPPDDGGLGALLERDARAHRRLPERRDHGDGGRGRLVRAGRSAVRKQHPELLRARPRARPASHAHADHAAGEPLESCLAAGRPVPRRAHRRGERQRRRDPRRPHAGDDRADRGRACGDALHRDPRRRRRRAICLRLGHPDSTRPACASSAARASTLAAATSTTRSASRFEEIDAIVDLRRRARPLRALLRAAQPRALQRHLLRDLGRRAHDASGRDADDRPRRSTCSASSRS